MTNGYKEKINFCKKAADEIREALNEIDNDSEIPFETWEKIAIHLGWIAGSIEFIKQRLDEI